MFDGQYDITLISLSGSTQGTLTLERVGDTLTGMLNVPGGNSRFEGGKVNGNKIELSGEVKTVLGPLRYTLTGSLAEDVLWGIVHTSQGLMTIMGSRR